MNIEVVSNDAKRQDTVESAKETKPVEQSADKSSAPAVDTDQSEITAEASETPAEKNESEAEELGESEDVRQKKKGGYKRRIDKLTARATSAEREIQELRQQLANAHKAPVEQQSKKSVDGAPNPDDFDTYADYLDARDEFREAQREQKAKQAKEAEAYGQVMAKHNDRVKAFLKTAPDFHEVIQSVDDIQAIPAIGQAILDSDFGPQIMYALAQDPEEFERINSLSPNAAVRAIGKLEATFSQAQSKPEPQKTTKAPAPLSPVGGKGGGHAKSLADMDVDEFIRTRNEQQRRR